MQAQTATVPAQQQAPQAPMPLDHDALRHVFGGGPGGSWSDDTEPGPGGSW